MRVKLENFRFSFYMNKKTGAIKDRRPDLVKAAEEHGCEARQLMTGVVTEHLANKPQEEVSWLKENFSDAAHTIADEWNTIKEAVSRGSTFYEEVSLKEKMEIVRAFNFGKFALVKLQIVIHSIAGSIGHFFNCENGHAFVITEVTPLRLSSLSQY
jgi:hypothetical protein